MHLGGSGDNRDDNDKRYDSENKVILIYKIVSYCRCTNRPYQ